MLLRLRGTEGIIEAAHSFSGSVVPKIRTFLCSFFFLGYLLNITLELNFVGSTLYPITEYKLESEVRLGNWHENAAVAGYFRKDFCFHF